MTAEVKAFPGVSQPDQPAELQPLEEVIRLLEDTLAEAKAGNIRGVAIAVIEGDTRTTQWWAGEQQHRLMASVCYLQYRMASHVVGKSDETVWTGDPA